MCTSSNRRNNPVAALNLQRFAYINKDNEQTISRPNQAVIPRRITTTIPESPEQSWPEVSPLIRKKRKLIRLDNSDSDNDHDNLSKENRKDTNVNTKRVLKMPSKPSIQDDDEMEHNANISDQDDIKPISKRLRHRDRNQNWNRNSIKQRKASNDSEEQSTSDESDDTDDSEYDLIIHDRAVQVAILSFLNQASLSDLAFIENVSVNKARYICELRPFQSWTDVVEKFNQTRSLSDDILWNCGDLLKRRNILHKLLDKCEELAGSVGNLMKHFDEDLVGNQKITEALVDSRSFKSEECVDKQPEILNNKYQLKSYQLVGLNWMLLLYKKGFNGILADEMGLGKTIQVIAFLSHLYQFGITGPHLIIVPSSTLDNWKRELKNWCPKLKVVLYYGSPEERFELRMDIARRTVKLHILLTTYHMCCTSPDDLQLFKKVKFTYAVFDEAHMLKNMMSKRYRALMRIRAQRKLLLTGTPLQNNLLELFSLLSFTMPDIFHDTKEYILNFFSTFKTDDKSTAGVPFVKGQIEQAKKIMKPFVLRRLKSEVMSQLPKKVQLKELCNMTERQEELYKKLMIKCSTAYNSSDTSKARKSILMDLRKMANHPSLHRIYYNDDMLREMAQIIVKEPSHHDANIEYVFEDMTVMNDFELHQLCNEFHVLSKYLMPQELLFDSGKIKCLDRLLPLMKERGDRVLLFSQFVMVLDIIECYIQYRGYSYLRMDGQTPIKDRLDLIDQFNDSEADKFIFLLSTKASGLGINLTSANVVILHDIDFNPHNDKQAEDRCHRVGQDKDVIVYRLICPDTIDQTMLQFCDNKLHLEKSVDGKESEKDNENSNIDHITKILFKT